LQLAVEMGMPLAVLVSALLGWALWRAWIHALREASADTEDGAIAIDTTTMPRAALAMVLMVLFHSLLEYPLWYAYFLLPAAFAFGIALGGRAEVEAVEADPPKAGATRPLMLASMLLLLGAMASAQDYFRVVAIFAPSESAAPLPQRITEGQRSWFFSHHGDYAAVTTVEHPSQAMAGFAGATHYLLDARLMMAWATALDEAGDADRARYVAQRLKEFRNEQAEAMFAPCAQARAAKAKKLFPCAEPAATLNYASFR
jgi:hypothetical protein